MAQARQSRLSREARDSIKSRWARQSRRPQEPRRWSQGRIPRSYVHRGLSARPGREGRKGRS